MKVIHRAALGVTTVLIAGACGGAPTSAPPTTGAAEGPAAPAQEQKTLPAQQRKAEPRKGETITLTDGTSTLFWGKADVRGKTSARLEMGDAGSGRFYFSPTILLGSPGQRLTLHIVNTSGEAHPFSTPSKRVEVAPSATATLTVRFPASGAVTFWCPHGHSGELRAS
jgi:hypothetical protein